MSTKGMEYLAYRRTIEPLMDSYRDLLSGADFVYLTSDALTGLVGRVLLDTVVGSRMLENDHVLMVSPGYEALCRSCRCDDASYRRPMPGEWLEGDDISWYPPSKRIELHDLYTSVKKAPGEPASLRSFHIMFGPDSEWDESGRLILRSGEPWGNVSERTALQQAVQLKRNECSQIVVSRDIELLKSLREQVPSSLDGKGPGRLSTLSLREWGDLYDPFEPAEEKRARYDHLAYQALAAIVQAKPLVVEASALYHPQVGLLLQHIKPALIEAGASLIIAAPGEGELPNASLLAALAQEAPSAVRVVRLDRLRGEEDSSDDALIELLRNEAEAHPSPEGIGLVTDRVSHGARIQERLALAGVPMEIYSVNGYGFLTHQGPEDAPSSAQGRSDEGARLRRRKISVAVRTGNSDEALALVKDQESLAIGIGACLKAHNAPLLERLLKRAESIPNAALDRWFSADEDLLVQAPFYPLLVLALSKCVFRRAQAKRWIEQLRILEGNPCAAKAELSFLISLLQRSAGGMACFIRRTDIPRELPMSEPKSEAEWWRCRLWKLEQMRERLDRDMQRLSAEREAVERLIAQTEEARERR